MTDPRDLFPMEDDEPVTNWDRPEPPWKDEHEEDDPNDHIIQDLIMGNR